MNDVAPGPRRKIIPHSGEDHRIGQILDFALWVTYLGTLGQGIFQYNDRYRFLSHLMVDLAGVLLILGGFITLRRKQVRKDLGHRIYYIYFLLWMSLMASTIGLIKSNPLINWSIAGTLPFLAMVAVIMASRQVCFDRVPRTLFRQISIAVVFNIYPLFINPPPSKGYWGGIKHLGLAKAFWQCLGALPFLVGYMVELKTWQVYVLFAAWLEYFLHAVLAAYRGILLAALLMPPLALFILWRTRQNIGRILRRTFAIFIIGLVGAVILSSLFTHRLGFDVTEAWNKTVARFTNMQAEDRSIAELGMGAYDVSQNEFIGEGGRALERRDFFETIEPVDYLLGRGFGGTWYSNFWGRQWGMVHFGPAHFILMGGVGLLLAYMLLYIAALWRSWVKVPGSPVSSGSFAMLLLNIVSFLKHGVPQDNFKTYLIWLCIGFGVSPHYRGKLEVIRAEIRRRAANWARRSEAAKGLRSATAASRER